jgi:ANTAR domain
MCVTAASIALDMAGLGRDGEPSAEYLLHGLTALAARLVPGCCAASISMWDGGRVHRSSVSHPDLAALRDLPRSPAEDPERHAHAQQQAVSIQNALAPAGWPAFCAAVAGFGIGSIVIQPVAAGAVDVTFGFYAARPYALQVPDLALIAGQAAGVLRDAERRDEMMSGVRGLRASLESRSVIDQAIGIIIAERSCTPERAFAEIRKISQTRNLKLAEVAKQLVSERSSR